MEDLVKRQHETARPSVMLVADHGAHSSEFFIRLHRMPKARDAFGLNYNVVIHKEDERLSGTSDPGVSLGGGPCSRLVDVNNLFRELWNAGAQIPRLRAGRG